MAEDKFIELGTEIGWDDEIEQESQYVLLPEGEYNFTVAAMERERFEGSEKMGPCNMAILTLAITNPKTGSPVSVTDRLYLNSKAEWKLSQFFISIGQKKHGEKLKPDWSKVPLSEGRCKIKIHKYTDRDGNGKEINQVGSYLEPKESPKFTPGEF